MKYHFKVHKEQNGFWAECIELDGCNTEAGNIVVLCKNMEEALNLYLDEPKSSDLIFPMPRKGLDKARNVRKVNVRPEIAVALLLRNIRLKSEMSQREFARTLGFKNLYSYQRLEKSGNPELKTLVMLKKRFPDIPFEEIFDLD